MQLAAKTAIAAKLAESSPVLGSVSDDLGTFGVPFGNAVLVTVKPEAASPAIVEEYPAGTILGHGVRDLVPAGVPGEPLEGAGPAGICGEHDRPAGVGAVCEQAHGHGPALGADSPLGDLDVSLDRLVADGFERSARGGHFEREFLVVQLIACGAVFSLTV